MDLLLVPDFRARGTRGPVIALVARPDTQLADVLERDFGAGILAEFNTGGGTGCEREEVQDAFDLVGESRQTRFPICFDLTIQSSAPLGTRTVTIELDMDGVAVIARAPFTVTPAVDETEGASLP